MRVLVDVLGAPSRSGGMRLYAEQLLSAWVGVAPEDELVVVGGPWIEGPFAGMPSVTPIVLPEGDFSRIAGQWLVSAWHARRTRADVVLSLSLVVSPLVGRRPRLCVVHDWRHLKHPEEFGRLQRAYRQSWVWSTNHATRAIQISRKTDEETARIAPAARRVVVENGQDHARSWPIAPTDPDPMPKVLTFGHQTNKRPDLVIRAMAHVNRNVAARLIVLGASGAYALELQALANGLGIGDVVDFPGFVADAEYEMLVQQASVIVLASTDEGFGLPVSEGVYFGIPVVSTDDNGIAQIHGGRAVCVPAREEALGQAITKALGQGRRTVDWVGNRWRDTAAAIRSVAESCL